MKLTDNEIKRYARQISLSDVGSDGQVKLKEATVLIIGVGGLGVAAAQYLAAAGIGTLILVDGDSIALSNLHRQPVYMEKDIGQNKADVLAKQLRGLNSTINVINVGQFIDLNNAVDLIDKVDIVLDCTDNLKSRYLINDVCTIHDKPFVSASIYKNEGQIGLFNYMGSGTYRCMYPEGETTEIPSCEELGVMGILPGILGLMQANEVLKIILKRGDLLTNKILYTSILNNITLSITYKRKQEDVQALINEGLTMKTDKIFSLNIDQLEQLNFEEWTWLDVRDLHESPELKNKLIKRIPLQNLQTSNVVLDSSSKVICFCSSGIRSLIAAEKLNENGIKTVRAFTGSIKELQAYKFFNGNDVRY